MKISWKYCICYPIQSNFCQKL